MIFICITSGTDKQSRRNTGTVKDPYGKNVPRQHAVYRGSVLVGQNIFITKNQERWGTEAAVFKDSWHKPCILT